MKKNLSLAPKQLEAIVLAVWGMSLMSIPLLLLVGGYLNGDLTLFKPIALPHKLGDLSSILHLMIGLCIMLGPSHRRLLGAMALVLLTVGFMLGLYFGQTVDEEIYTPLLPLMGVLYSFGWEGIPTLYLLVTGYRGRGHRVAWIER